MPKHVGVGTYHRLCFMIVIYRISLSAFVGQYNECKKIHGMSNIKFCHLMTYTRITCPLIGMQG